MHLDASNMRSNFTKVKDKSPAPEQKIFVKHWFILNHTIHYSQSNSLAKSEFFYAFPKETHEIHVVYSL